MRLFRQIAIYILILAMAAGLMYLYQSYRKPQPWNISGLPNHNLKVLKRTVYYIQNNYVAPDQLIVKELLKKALHIMQQGLAPVMVRWDDNSVIIEVTGQSRRFQVPETLSLRDMPDYLGHVVDFVEATLPEDDEDGQEENIEYLLIGGVVSALDPHSSFLRPKIYSEFKIGTTGNFGGIGIAIGIRDGYLTVIAPLEGTPAYRAGLKAKDQIIQINDEPTINMFLSEAVERLRGKIGTTVTILVRRENVSDPLSFTIRRALIMIDSVKTELLAKEKIALVKIKNFQEDTISEFHRNLRKLSVQAKGLNGIILDLRNNPGGLLDQSVSMADAFLADGIIVSTVGLSHQLHEEEKAHSNDIYETIPLVVIVNEGSASASEILAGAVQVHGRAIILGKKTFGKGTIQTLYDLKDGSALKLTIGKYLAAGTEDVQVAGITPDVSMNPLHISEKSVDLIENQARREFDLEKRFEQAQKIPEKKSLFKLPYLEVEEEPEKVTGTVQITHDFPVELAKRILTIKQEPNRNSQLEIIRKMITDLEAEQDQHLTEKLAKQDIDWTTAPSHGEPQAKTEFWISLDDQKIDQPTGGQEVKFHLSVENTGEGSFYRLLAVTESENPLFSDLEFPLGRIEPGDTRHYAIDVNLPASIPAQRIPMKISFSEHYNNYPKQMEIPINIREADSPRFTYSWEFKNPQETLKPYKDIDLVFHIKNLGPGQAQEPVLNLANMEDSHVVLKKGRAKLDPIDVEKTVDAFITIRLKKETPLREARLFVSLEDRKTGYILKDSLIFADDPAAYSPQMGEWQHPPQFTLELPDNPYWSTKKKYNFSGAAQDDDRMKEIYVFNNFDKIFYKSLRKDPQVPAPFSVNVLLETGLNRISVITKDVQDLITRKQWIIWKPKE